MNTLYQLFENINYTIEKIVVQLVFYFLKENNNNNENELLKYEVY
jgi:hypothetical protein